MFSCGRCYSSSGLVLGNKNQNQVWIPFSFHSGQQSLFSRIFHTVSFILVLNKQRRVVSPLLDFFFPINHEQNFLPSHLSIFYFSKVFTSALLNLSNLFLPLQIMVLLSYHLNLSNSFVLIVFFCFSEFLLGCEHLSCLAVHTTFQR